MKSPSTKHNPEIKNSLSRIKNYTQNPCELNWLNIVSEIDQYNLDNLPSIMDEIEQALNRWPESVPYDPSVDILSERIAPFDKHNQGTTVLPQSIPASWKRECFIDGHQSLKYRLVKGMRLYLGLCPQKPTLDGIESFPNIQALYIFSPPSHETKVCIEKVSLLRRLKSITLNGPGFDTVAPLANLNELKNISLMHTSVSNLTPTQEIKSISRLSIHQIHPFKLPLLDQLIHLKEVSLSEQYNNLEQLLSSQQRQHTKIHINE